MYKEDAGWTRWEPREADAEDHERVHDARELVYPQLDAYDVSPGGSAEAGVTDRFRLSGEICHLGRRSHCSTGTRA